MKDPFHARLYSHAGLGTTSALFQPMETKMSRDWFTLTRKPLLTKHSDPLADPLDGGDWQGLEWTLPLLARMSGGDRQSPTDGALPHPHARIQTRSPFLIR